MNLLILFIPESHLSTTTLLPLPALLIISLISSVMLAMILLSSSKKTLLKQLLCAPDVSTTENASIMHLLPFS